MSTSDSIRALLGISGKKSNELAEALGISPQALNNKMSRESFSAEDLIIAAKLTDASLLFERKDSKVYLHKKEEFDTYSLADGRQVAKLISMTNISESSDFLWFLNSAKDAVTKKAEVEVTKYPSGTELIEYKGKIEQMSVIFNPEQQDQSTIIYTINVNSINRKEQEPERIKFSYVFDAAEVEENRNSTPGQFLKYYINEKNGVKYTIIFKDI